MAAPGCENVQKFARVKGSGSIGLDPPDRSASAAYRESLYTIYSTRRAVLPFVNWQLREQRNAQFFFLARAVPRR